MREKHGHILETVLGAVVLAVAGLFLVFAYTNSQFMPSSKGYSLNARFDRVDGLKVGSDVRVGGIVVGKVLTQFVHPKTFLAEVNLTILEALKFPTDTSAEIVSDGLLGDKYIALIPGGDKDTLKPGEEIKYTQSSINLESLIGQAMFNKKDQ